MFTGIIEELGRVAGVDGDADAIRLSVRADVVRGSALGESIAVNGVCLTVTEIDGDIFTADVMRETLERTSIGGLTIGAAVNVERPVTLGTRLGGHLVQGHVDGVGTVVERVPGNGWERVTVSIPSELGRYLVPKGSVALDGVSLTVAALDGDRVTVSLIPETLQRTTLGRRGVGEPVNVEVDVLAKHVERLLAARMEQT